MSDLLNQASLVMVPSGYKEDTVYSVVPSDGSGDLSFTRASNGTRVNSAGLVEVVPWNLITYSEQIDNPAWAKEAGNSIIADTTTAPYGTLTADTISVASSFNMNTYEIVSTNEGIHTYSVYLKKNVTNLISLYIYQTFGASGFKALGEINFDNGTFTVSVGTGTIESVGNGWFRLTLTATLLSGANSCGFYTSSTTGTRTVYAWGAQLNIGSTAKPYFPTTDRLNVPRLTYQNGGGGCPSLLLEKQSTNLVTYSEQFDNADWTKLQTSISANSVTSPDGTTNADTLTADGSSNEHQLRSTGIFTITSGQSYTTSIFAKVGTNNFVQLIGSGAIFSTTTYANFNIATGVVGDVGAGTIATIENFGNGWYRCSITATSVSTSSTNTFLFNIITSNTAIRGESNTLSTSVYIYGAQVEASSYKTSYIPTTSSSATRVADACYKTGISSLIGQTEGVLFVDFNNVTNPEAGDYNMLATISDSANEYIYISKRNPTGIEIYGGTGASTYITSGVFVDGQRYKVALAYKNNDFAVYINGTSIWTDTSGTINVTTPNKFSLGSYYSQILNFNSGINQAALFKTRLTNAELASLTTI